MVKLISDPFRQTAPKGAKWNLSKHKVSRLGSNREKAIQKLNKKFGENTWRFAWQAGENQYLDFNSAIKLFEDSYTKHLEANPNKRIYLEENASDVFDTTETNIESGTDYHIQNTPALHFQDIAIRRAMAKLGADFKGEGLIQVRTNSKNQIGKTFSPTTVEFIKPEIINGSNNQKSVEDFWQLNRVIQFCDDLTKLPLEERKKFVQDSPFQN